MNDFVNELIDIFGADKVWTGDALVGRSASHLEYAPLKARALLLPDNTQEVSEMLRLCNAVGQIVVPQGGMTNLVYDTHTGEEDIALSLERMNRVEEIDPLGGTMTVQTGAVLQDVHRAAAKAGLFFPLDLPAREKAVIGGMIGTNAGGLRVVRYGMIRDMVLGLEVVLANGTILNSMNKMLKKNAGYDIKQLFIGSEGTLGVVTRAVLRLWPKQEAAATALVAVDRFQQVAELLALAKEVLSGQLTSFEVLWNDFYRLTTTPPAPHTAPLNPASAFYVLIESLGRDQDEEQARMNRLLDQASGRNLITESVLAQSASHRTELWQVREDTKQMDEQYPLTFHFDISLPIAAMERYVEQIRAEMAAAFGEVKLWVFGHLADGNLHLGVWGAEIRDEDHSRLERIVYQPLHSLGGSISAEHGIGLRKKPYLGLSRSAEEIAVMRQIKAALDPRGILNPGKIFDPMARL